MDNPVEHQNDSSQSSARRDLMRTRRLDALLRRALVRNVASAKRRTEWNQVPVSTYAPPGGLDSHRTAIEPGGIQHARQPNCVQAKGRTETAKGRGARPLYSVLKA